MEQKSLFLSTTFWGAVGSLVVTLSPIIGGVALDDQAFSSRDLEIAVSALVTCVVTVLGRMNAKSSVYTPNFVLGPNKIEEVITDQDVSF